MYGVHMAFAHFLYNFIHKLIMISQDENMYKHTDVFDHDPLINQTSPLTCYSKFLQLANTVPPIPVVQRSRKRVCGRSRVGIAVSNPAGARKSVYCKCCVLSCRGLCDGTIPRPEESYDCGVSLCVV
jgi:hypothetical protein